MKEIINNALNEINDKYIDEAYHADHLQNTTARTVRNIAIPVASVAAVAGLCLGLGKLGVFKSHGGVDLLPADSTSGAGDTSSIIVDDPQYEYTGYTPILPDTMPIVLQTTDHIESIVFGSQFPEMLYADEDSAMFTDGISGLYIFDFDTEQISFAADIYTTFDLALGDFPEKIGTNYGADSWSGIELFTGADGTPYCSMAYHSDIVLTGSGLPTQSQWQTKYYEIDTESLTLTALPEDEMTIPLYEGLKEIPYSENEDYRNMSLNAAYIGDTDEFVYIRNSPTDIDLLPEYNMEYIELRRWTAEEVTGEPMEGGYYPFSDNVGKDAVLYSRYYTSLYETVDNSHWLNFDSLIKFWFDVWGEVDRVPMGRCEQYGDIISLTEETSGYKWMYRIDGDTLIPLDIIGEQSTTTDIEQYFGGQMLYKESDMPAEEVLPTAYEQITGYCDNIKSELESDELTDAKRKEIEEELDAYQQSLAEIEAHMQEAGCFTYEAQDFLASLDPRVAAAVKEFIPVAPNDDFWADEGSDTTYGIVTAHAIRMLDKSISVMDDGEAEMLLNDDRRVYSMCLDSYWVKDDGNETVASDYAYQVDELDKALTDMILSSELSYSGSADMENMLYPLDPKYNYITSYFGYDSFRVGTHYGIDIADEGIGGADIYATQDGMVIHTYKDSGWHGGYGNYVIIDHGNGYCTLYAHCYEVYVSTGDEVKRGEVIAAVGTTGWSTGNHLHFEVRKDGIAVDPLSFSYDDVQPVKYDSFEAALKFAFENAGEPVFPDSIAMPIDSNGNTVKSVVYDEYTEYCSYANADVLAANKGEIVFAGYTGDTDECCIIILHEGYVTVYRGLGDYKFVEGNHVDLGQSIGISGDDGTIRFELHTESTEYDPSTCRPISETNIALTAAFAESDEPNIPAQLYAPVDDNSGYISEYFYGDYRYGMGGYYGHKGIDISAEYGTDINAAADGEVIVASWYGDYGYCIIIMHDGYATVYGHLSDMSVKEGDNVAAGQLIGSVGSTGRSTDNHLHFEIRTAPEEQINPIDYMPYTE